MGRRRGGEAVTGSVETAGAGTGSAAGDGACSGAVETSTPAGTPFWNVACGRDSERIGGGAGSRPASRASSAATRAPSGAAIA
ncbi:MAG: hypothetical protein M0D55_00175 [Elusimicrobiota bacterium]|nr:MAG: hypothetical protein M0D55_00175 [Elusimicrobiota bacterium]